MVTMHLTPARVTVVLLGVIAALVTTHALSLFGYFELGRDHQPDQEPDHAPEDG